MTKAEVERVREEGGVIGSDVEDDGEGGRGRDAGSGCVEGEFADLVVMLVYESESRTKVNILEFQHH